jgi:hypothetical protein
MDHTGKKTYTQQITIQQKFHIGTKLIQICERDKMKQENQIRGIKKWVTIHGSTVSLYEYIPI